MSDQTDTRSIRFAGRVALVTGAAQGLGAQYAASLDAGGAKVVVADLKDAKFSRPRDRRRRWQCGTALFLAPSDSDLMTGQTLVVDGGGVMQ